MVALIFVLASISAALAAGISIDSLAYIILPIMKSPSVLPWVKHLLFWPSLAVSVLFGREVFWWIVEFISAEDENEAQEVLK